ncbi:MULTISPECIES: TatD family hydrolase [Bacillaceae]|uniref:TatD family hydrolase n=1 Tax=Bacillaceae TaxID=186817 RepID=UPI0010F5CD4F|nr:MULTISPECIES: TatD family hydrolase [Bacillaceae]MEC1742281.1 TatD family hydrolase [Schinkia azotoformans]MEC1767490.1 TatD family hydrolase [Schinkia azotoformans]MEC1788582.1 TatD family hydrolase [Schinkia azotoformans]MED4419813.1 TatD family hydrolase [Schinkia azotoformans]
MSNLSDMHVHVDYFKNFKQMYDSFEINKIYALFVTNLPEIFQKCKYEFPDSKYVKVGLGYNPQLVEKYKFNKKLFDAMLPLTKYVGEVGLDYSKEFAHTKLEQQEAFDYICSESAKAKKIMSIHSRGADEDVLRMLIDNKVEFAVFHWFSGNKEFVYKVVEEGYYFSVNYSMLVSKKGFEIIKTIPIDRLLIETDAPFGKTSIKGVRYNLAEIYTQFSKKLDVNQFENIIYTNLSRLLSKQIDSSK